MFNNRQRDISEIRIHHAFAHALAHRAHDSTWTAHFGMGRAASVALAWNAIKDDDEPELAVVPPPPKPPIPTLTKGESE